jgi:hypothetical protein
LGEGKAGLISRNFAERIRDWRVGGRGFGDFYRMRLISCMGVGMWRMMLVGEGKGEGSMEGLMRVMKL